MVNFLKSNEAVALIWEERFESVFTLLDTKFRAGNPHALLCSMRALLLLLKAGKKPTAAQVLRRIREEDDTSPQGPRAGYDEAKWFSFIADAVEALKVDNPLKIVEKL